MEISYEPTKLFRELHQSEEWIHKVIEITALETNTYVAMTEFKMKDGLLVVHMQLKPLKMATTS